MRHLARQQSRHSRATSRFCSARWSSGSHSLKLGGNSSSWSRSQHEVLGHEEIVHTPPDSPGFATRSGDRKHHRDWFAHTPSHDPRESRARSSPDARPRRARQGGLGSPPSRLSPLARLEDTHPRGSISARRRGAGISRDPGAAAPAARRCRRRHLAETPTPAVDTLRADRPGLCDTHRANRH